MQAIADTGLLKALLDRGDFSVCRKHGSQPVPCAASVKVLFSCVDFPTRRRGERRVLFPLRFSAFSTVLSSDIVAFCEDFSGKAVAQASRL